MKKKHSKFLLPGILMVGVILRAPFAVLPVVLGDIAKGLQVPVNSLGLLTSLPLIMFALCSAFSPRLAQKVGLEKLFTMAMIVLTLGSFIRIFNLPLLYAGTIMLGAAIAVLNVLLPNVIQANQPEKIGFLTALYHFYGTGHLNHVSLGCAYCPLNWLERIDSRPDPHLLTGLLNLAA